MGDRREFQKSAIWALGLIGLLALNGFVLAHWVRNDTRPLAWDEAIHTSIALEYRHRIAEEGFFSILKPATFNYPPLYHLTLAPVLSIPQEVADAGAIINFFYLAILIISLFLLADFMMGRWAAISAAFLVSAYPIFQKMACFNLLDVALSAWVALAMLCLVRSEDFSKLGWSAGFGAAAAMAQLTKWPALGYLLAPLIYVFVRGMRRKNFKGLLISCLAFGVLVAPWYLYNWIPVLRRVIGVANMAPAADIALPPGMKFLWYPAALFEQLNLTFVLLLLPGLLVFVWRPKVLVITLWFLGSLFFFSLIKNQNIRYTMPALPAAALLTVAWLPSNRRITFIFFNLITASFFFLLHFVPDSPWILQTKIGAIPIVGRQYILRGDWQQKAIVERIIQLKGGNQRFSRVLTISNAPFFHSTSLNVTRELMGVNNFEFRGPSAKRTFEMQDFVLLKTGDLGPVNTIGAVQESANFIQNKKGWFNKIFREAGRWPLPDNSEAILYVLDPKPMNTMGARFLFDLELKEFVLPNIVAKNVKFRASGGSKKDLSQGKFKELNISCEEVVYQGIRFENVLFRLVNPQINLPLLLEKQELQLLYLDRMEPKAEIDVGPLIALILSKTRMMNDLRVDFDQSNVEARGNIYGVPFGVKASLMVGNEIFHSRLRSIRIFGIPLPTYLFRAVTDLEEPLTPNAERPFFLDFKSLTGRGNILEINS